MRERATHLVLEEAAAERPDAAEDEVELVPLLGTVDRRVLRHEHALQQVAQHLQVADVGDRRDLLEARAHHVEAERHVLVEEDRQVGALRLHLARIDPTADRPAARTAHVGTGQQTARGYRGPHTCTA